MPKGPWIVLAVLAAILCRAAPSRAGDAPAPPPPATTQPAEPAAAETISLKTVFQPGEYLVVQTTQLEQKITVDDRQQPAQTMQVTLTMREKVGPPDARGQRDVSVRFERVQLETALGARKIAFDTAGPSDQAQASMAAIYQALLAAEIVLTVDAAGQVVGSRGLTELWDDLAARNPQMAPLAAQMKAQMGEAFLRELFGKGARALPEKPVPIGARWVNESTVTLPFLGPAKVEHTTRLAAIEQTDAGPVAVLAATGTIRAKDKTTTALGAAKMTFTDVDLTQEIRTRLHVRNACLADVALTQTGLMQGEVVTRTDDDAEPPARQPRRIRIRQTMTVRTTCRPAPAATSRPGQRP